MPTKNLKSLPTLTSVTTRIGQVICLVGLITTVVIACFVYSSYGSPFVADPTKAYALSDINPEGNLGDFIWTSPATWIAIGLIAALVVITLVRIVHIHTATHESLGPEVTVPLVIAGVITLIGVIALGTVSNDTKDGTFSTWAKQRYGIAIENYPGSDDYFLFDDDRVDTDVVITLDNGQTVRMVEITDARGKTAYVIAPAEGSDEELDVIAD